MTLADRIRTMGKTESRTGIIADTLGCNPSYVRVVLRQRINGTSDNDRRYLATPAGKISQQAANAAECARHRALVASVDLKIIRAIQADALTQARAQGMSEKKAKFFAWSVRRDAIQRLGNKVLAAQAAAKARKEARRQATTKEAVNARRLNATA